MTDALMDSLRRRHRNGFGNAYPLVRYDELQELLDHVTDLEHELADVTFSRELQFKAANLNRERAERAEVLLRRLAEWDMLYVRPDGEVGATGDAPYWQREIALVLNRKDVAAT